MKQIPDTELRLEFARSSGPGGQNVNKLETKVRLRWDFAKSNIFTAEEKTLIEVRLHSKIVDGEIMVESQKTRSQRSNIQDAKEKLETLISNALIPARVRRKTRPTKAAKEKRLDAKRRQSEKKVLRRRIIE